MMRQDYVDSGNKHLEFLQAIGNTVSSIFQRLYELTIILQGSGYVFWIFPELSPPSCVTQNIWGPISIDIFSDFLPGQGSNYVGTHPD